jgi:hypothetical protein
VVKLAGFERVRAGCMVDVFSGSPHESSAKNYDTRGLAFSARKPQ